MSADLRDDILGPLAASATAWCGFDAAWYRIASGPNLADADAATLLRHYLDEGRHAGRGPNIFFDEAWYRATTQDAAAAIADGTHASGYEHYCATGYLTRSAHWLYDDDLYSLTTPELTDHVLVLHGCANRYDHYLKAGASERRVAHLLFQPDLYCATIAPAADQVWNPFQHYLLHLWETRTDSPTSLYFDPVWYLAHTPAAREAIADRRVLGALHHFLAAPDAGDPHPAFSARHYGGTMPDAVAMLARGECRSLYDHFLKFGVHHLASPAQGVDLAAHLASNPDARRAIEAREVRDLFAHYVLHTQSHQVAPDRPPADALKGGGPQPRPAPLPGVAGTLELGIDSSIRCPPDGIVLNGWMLAPPGLVQAMHLVCGAQLTVIDPHCFVPTARADVLEGFRSAGYDDPMCGFIAYVPGDPPAGERLFLETRLTDGTTLMHAVPAPVLHGIAAIRSLLDCVDLRYDALATAMRHVIAPAVARLGTEFNAQPLPREVIQFGIPSQAPRRSLPGPSLPGLSLPTLTLIIPLHGRLDFMEIQLALFSRGPQAMGHDIIYVLDDPPRRRAAEVLAAACFARFAIPFRLVALGRNAGYAVANNVALALARGRHVALVNSDVFPTTPADFDHLAARLDADPGLGAVGPLLLYEDGSVQHQGMAFERLPEYANMHFPLHPRKGLLPPTDGALHEVPAITGACMVLPRALLEQLNGLDPAFLIGDFEDADLCLRLAAAGRRIAVDHGVHMHHLERQSQAGSERRWRMNLTLCNAWVHEQRWGATLERDGRRWDHTKP